MAAATVVGALLGSSGSGKNVFTIHINEADSGLARNLVEGIESVQIASA